MSAIQPWCYLLGINPQQLTKVEILLLEAEMYRLTCNELKEFFRKQHAEFFQLMKFTIEKENAMLESNFLRLIIKDILLTEEYDLEGMALYVNTHEDVLHEIICGLNTNPSALLLQRCIELHRIIRRDLYDSIIKKIVTENLLAA